MHKLKIKVKLYIILSD